MRSLKPSFGFMDLTFPRDGNSESDGVSVILTTRQVVAVYPASSSSAAVRPERPSKRLTVVNNMRVFMAFPFAVLARGLAQRGTSGTPRPWCPSWNEEVIAGLPAGAGWATAQVEVCLRWSSTKTDHSPRRWRLTPHLASSRAAVRRGPARPRTTRKWLECPSYCWRNLGPNSWRPAPI